MNNILDPYGYMIPEIFYEAGGYDTWCTQYQTVYDSFTTKPTAAIAEQQNTMVLGLVNSGIWAKLDVFYITASQSLADSLINWITPGTHDLTVHNLIAGLWTQYRGWTGNGINGYLNTNYKPDTDGVNYVLNDASFGCYVRTNINESSVQIGLNQTTGDTLMFMQE